MRMVIQLDFCCPFCIPDATMHSTYRVDSAFPSPIFCYYVTSMATVLSAILFSAGLSSS